MKWKKVCAVAILAAMMRFVYPVNALNEDFSGEVEYQFMDSELSESKKELIIQSILIETTYMHSMGINGLSCIFGHDLATGTTRKTTHNAYTTSPKCLEELYSYEICQRSDCSYSKIALIYSSRIVCH